MRARSPKICCSFKTTLAWIISCFYKRVPLYMLCSTQTSISFGNYVLIDQVWVVWHTKVEGDWKKKNEKRLTYCCQSFYCTRILNSQKKCVHFVCVCAFWGVSACSCQWSGCLGVTCFPRFLRVCSGVKVCHECSGCVCAVSSVNTASINVLCLLIARWY